MFQLIQLINLEHEHILPLKRLEKNNEINRNREKYTLMRK